METVDTLVIGTGVVGLAAARSLALDGREVMVLEAADAIGTATSSRNSEVIHAGIYYAAGSLKAKFCVEGKSLLYRYCDERGVPYRRCGKLLVATADDEVTQIDGIIARAAANGVHDLVRLSADEARAMEPALTCVAAVQSPSTGIVDSHALMLALQGDLENAGGLVAFNTPVTTLAVTRDGIVVRTADGTELLAARVVNAAGHGARFLPVAAGLEGMVCR